MTAGSKVAIFSAVLPAGANTRPSTTDQAKTMKKLFVLLAMAMLPALAQAQILKCVGVGGRVEFASSCPAGTKAENTGIRNAPAAASSANPQKSLAERDAEFRKRQVEQQEAAKKTEEKSRDSADRAQNCESAKGYLNSLQKGNRIAKTDPKTGEVSGFLEDTERKVEIERAQRSVESSCN